MSITNDGNFDSHYLDLFGRDSVTCARGASFIAFDWATVSKR